MSIHSPEVLEPPVPKAETVGPYERVRLGGDEFAVCGRIDIGSQRIAVLDVGFKSMNGKYGPYDLDGSGNPRSFDKPYVLMTQVQTEDGPELLTHQFDAGETVILGRSTELPSSSTLGLQTDEYVSRMHARLTIGQGGTMRVEDMLSTNGTKTWSARELLGDPDGRFEYTQGTDKFVHRLGKGDLLKQRHEEIGWGQGMYAGRPKIARDTPINGGVYLVGGAHGEALVIDDQKYPRELNEVYDEVRDALTHMPAQQTAFRGVVTAVKGVVSSATTEQALKTVFEVARKKLTYDIEATNNIARDYTKVSLNSYILQGVGVCRTQAALCAYVLERLTNEGRLSGRVSIDRNVDHKVDGGHAWARFTDESGTVFIIDPAQRYVGTLAQSRQMSKWDYRRSEDLVSELLRADAPPN